MNVKGIKVQRYKLQGGPKDLLFNAGFFQSF